MRTVSEIKEAIVNNAIEGASSYEEYVAACLQDSKATASGDVEFRMETSVLCARTRLRQFEFALEQLRLAKELILAESVQKEAE